MIEGLPTPEWSMQGTEEALVSFIGNGFEFMSLGWYEMPGRTVLIAPLKFETETSTTDLLTQLSQLFGMGPIGGNSEGREYVCYSWSTDPRPAMRQMLRLGDQTEVAVPQALRDAWPQLEAMGVEIKAWGDVEVARVAADHGVAPIEVPSLGPCPTHFIKEHVDVHESGMMIYRVRPYVIHVMDAEQQRVLTERARGPGGPGIPPYARLFSVGDVGIALSLRPG